MTRTINRIPIMLAVTLSLAAFPACKRNNEAKERVQAQWVHMEEEFEDSLESIEKRTESVKNEISVLNEEADRLLPKFKYVENPREVEGYYIYKSWASTYPLKTTGLVMRLTKGEKAELIAALSGGAHFNRIRVTAGGKTAESGTVPHDQALNYRMEGLNTVCFSDSASDSCAKLIADYSGDDVTIQYLDGDRKTGELKYPAKSKEALTDSWRLYDSRRRAAHDERLLTKLAKEHEMYAERLQNYYENPRR